MVTVIIIRNTMSFAVGCGVTPWVTNTGYQNAFILAAFAGLAQVLTFLAVVKWKGVEGCGEGEVIQVCEGEPGCSSLDSEIS